MIFWRVIAIREVLYLEFETPYFILLSGHLFLQRFHIKTLLPNNFQQTFIIQLSKTVLPTLVFLKVSMKEKEGVSNREVIVIGIIGVFHARFALSTKNRVRSFCAGKRDATHGEKSYLRAVGRARSSSVLPP